jgi:hypothetical protein
VLNPLLHICDRPPGISFKPLAIEGFGHDPKLNDEVAGEVFRLDLAPLLAPETDESNLIVTEDDPSV